MPARMIEINCETDFVSKNDSFLALANAAAMLVAKNNPADVAALGALAYEQDGFGPTLEDVREGLIGKIGENMSFRRFKRFAGNGKLASYLHGTRIGVMVEFEGDDTSAKDVAMHIAAMKPVAISGIGRARRPDRQESAQSPRARPTKTARPPKPPASSRSRPTSSPSASKAACRSTSRKSRCTTSRS